MTDEPTFGTDAIMKQLMEREERASLLDILASAFKRARDNADTPLHGAVMIESDLNKAGYQIGRKP